MYLLMPVLGEYEVWTWDPNEERVEGRIVLLRSRVLTQAYRDGKMYGRLRKQLPFMEVEMVLVLRGVWKIVGSWNELIGWLGRVNRERYVEEYEMFRDMPELEEVT